ncbi:hypothetical protein [Bordetella sp. LUAb4]|uniref:hypothetical protein n=1 Tax=Bordetella sp. LUAb4 TaxID=2843195 RepID=UPI001E536536|nr:hypothetical protein [Bordetella sp. LUAb4]
MAIQTLTGTRLRGTRNPVRSEARTSGAVIPARSDARISGAVIPVRKGITPKTTPETTPRPVSQDWLSDVDAWALPFDLACGGSAVPAPRGPRGDTYVVWS